MGKMVQDKLEGYQFENHINGYNDMLIDTSHQNYIDSKLKVRNIKYLIMDKLETLYDNYVRQDPFRPLYNY